MNRIIPYLSYLLAHFGAKRFLVKTAFYLYLRALTTWTLNIVPQCSNFDFFYGWIHLEIYIFFYEKLFSATLKQSK